MDYEKHIGVYPDFPKVGISFKDISPLVADAEAFHAVIDDMAEHAKKYQPDLILGAESRGFIFGSALAYKMNLGFVMGRKAGKLPGTTIKASYSLEYGTATLEIPSSAIQKGQRVLLVDDLMATGGTFDALKKIVEVAGGTPVACLTLINLEELHGEKMVGLPCESLLTLSDSH